MNVPYRETNDHTSVLAKARVTWPLADGVQFGHSDHAGCGCSNVSLADLVLSRGGRVLRVPASVLCRLSWDTRARHRNASWPPAPALPTGRGCDWLADSTLTRLSPRPVAAHLLWRIPHPSTHGHWQTSLGGLFIIFSHEPLPTGPLMSIAAFGNFTFHWLLTNGGYFYTRIANKFLFL